MWEVESRDGVRTRNDVVGAVCDVGHDDVDVASGDVEARGKRAVCRRFKNSSSEERMQERTHQR